MNHTSPKLPIHAGFAHYVKLVNPTANPTKYPLYTQTVFIRTIASDKLTTTSDFYTMASVNRTMTSDKFAMTSVERTIASVNFTIMSARFTTAAVERTTNKYLSAFHFNLDNRQLSVDNSPL